MNKTPNKKKLQIFALSITLLLPLFSPFLKSNGALIVPQPIHFDLIDSPSGKLVLAYVEYNYSISKIVLLETDENKHWNLTRNYNLNKTTNRNVVGGVDLHFWNNSFLLSCVYYDGVNYTLEILKHPVNNSHWEQFYSYNNSKEVSNAKIASKTNEYLWLTWMEYNNSIKQSYFRIFNQTSYMWTNKTCLSENEIDHTGYLAFTTDLYNNGYFVWSEGPVNLRRVYFRKVYENETMGTIVLLTSGIHECIESTILTEADNTTHVMWSNYTDPDAGDIRGTINIGYRRMNPQGEWNEEELVAPFKSIFKPGQSDAFMPSIVIDGLNTMWLAFAARDDYYHHQGINLRTRISGLWQDEERVSQSINAAMKPRLVCDTQNNIHCVWIDYRSAYASLYYRVKSSLGIWSEELLLTSYVIESDIFNMWILYGLVIAAAVVIPIILTNLVKKYQKKKVISKRKKLIE
ncbi:MAG: hypothetical protein FK732_01850 [Asgard group archaeon]|nr:hypothetical protein [Asgard group archaeon]